jgi:hypothetical protein
MNRKRVISACLVAWVFAIFSENVAALREIIAAAEGPA